MVETYYNNSYCETDVDTEFCNKLIQKNINLSIDILNLV